MSINLVSGFQGHIQIKDQEDVILYQKSYSSLEEITDFIQQNGKSTDGWSLLRGTVIPLRTQNLQDFAKDFFLPTFVHFSLKINNIALRIFASIFAIILDIITVPIRLLATPFRIYYNYNYPENEHPLINLIKANPLSQKAIENNIVNLCYEIQRIRIRNYSDEEGNAFQEAIKSTKIGTIRIALKMMPGGILNQSSLEENQSYRGTNGEWTAIDSSTSRVTSYYSYAC